MIAILKLHIWRWPHIVSVVRTMHLLVQIALSSDTTCMSVGVGRIFDFEFVYLSEA